MVFPSAIGRSNFVSWNFFEFRMLSIDTLWRFLLGTSMPIVPLPGIGAIIRTPKADRRRAISSSRLRILVIRIPSAGVISYSVMVGPTVAFISLISMPKLLSTLTISSLCVFISSMSTYGFPSLSSRLRRSSPGRLYLVKGSSGLMGVSKVVEATFCPDAFSSFPTSTVRRSVGLLTVWLAVLVCAGAGFAVCVLLADVFALIAEKFVRSMTDDVSSLRGVASLV